MPEWVSCTLWSGLVGLVAGGRVASLHEWWHIGPLRRRCWQAEVSHSALKDGACRWHPASPSPERRTDSDPQP
jgi:hypothetical protein